MASTIRDVAKEAGVSIATVSRVINRTNLVRKETRRKVMAATRKLKFYPDHTAQAMVSKKTRSVGLLVPTLLNEYWATFCESVQRALMERGHSLFLGTLEVASEDYLEEMLRSMMQRKMDGLIFGAQRPHRTELPRAAARAESIDTSYQQRVAAVLGHAPMPVVSFGQEHPEFSSVRGDHRQGGVIAAEYLCSLGHREIAFIGGDPLFRRDQDPRELGFRETLAAHGRALKESLVRYVPFSFENGYQAAAALASSGRRFTALFCWNDLLAVGALNALVDRSIRVPQDVSVIGFDDISVARITRPALTTIHQPIAELAHAAVDVLFESMQAGPGFIPKKVLLATELVERGSCARVGGPRGERKDGGAS